MKKHTVKWKTWDSSLNKEVLEMRTFDDVQWKEYGLRATQDEYNRTFIIPYTSIYDVEVIGEGEDI